MGKDEQTIIERARQFNGPIPERIKNAPELLPGLEIYINAFNILSRGRTRGEGWIGPIPYGNLSQYLHDHGFAGEDWDDAIEIITAIDEAYVKWQTEHFKKMRASAEAAAPKPASRQRK